MKKYLMERATSLPAWIGAAGFLAELVFHMGDVSTVMLVMCAALVTVPEESMRAAVERWRVKLNDWLEDEK